MNTVSSHFGGMPATRLGLRSIRLQTAFVVMFILNLAVQLLVFENYPALYDVVRPAYMLFVIGMLACGIAGGVFGGIAAARQGERSFLVWISILLGLFGLLILLNELWQGLAYMLNL